MRTSNQHLANLIEIFPRRKSHEIANFIPFNKELKDLRIKCHELLNC